MAITKIEVPELFDFGSDNSAFKLPTGTTAERPTSPSNGEMRFNTTTGYVEYYDTTDAQWWEIDYAPIVASDNFNTVIYTGNNSTQSISTVGFEPGMIWFKNRNGTNSHAIVDVVRGRSSYIYPDLTAVANSSGATNDVTSFDSLGFSLGSVSQAGSTNTTTGGSNNLVAWSWKAGGTAVSNTDGSVASLVSANTAAGFSIVTNTSPTGAYTWGHGLSKAPELWIHKATDYVYGWETIYPDTFGQAAGSNNPSDWNRIFLNTAAATTTNTFYSATDTVLSNTGWGQVNNFVTYCWHSVAGYSKIGSYAGTGAAGNSIVTGFEPAFVMFKSTSGAYYWYMIDNKRNTSNPRNSGLFPNDSLAEITSSNYNVDFNSNGFTLQNNTTGFNESGSDYIYMAFAT